MAGNTWLGVVRHLSFTGNFAGQNGLGTWGIEDAGLWRFDLRYLNRRDVTFQYGETGQSSGGTAWEATIPGTVLGLPEKVEGKVIIQEGHPDVTYLAGINLEYSFKTLIEKLGVNLIMNDRVQRVLGRYWSHLFPLFDRLAANAPAFTVSGALGFGLGINAEVFETGEIKPYLRLLTSAEAKLETNLAGAVGESAEDVVRFIGAHEIDLTFGRGGGRSWQISSLANIPNRGM